MTRGSARTIFEQNLLGYSCARVCPVEVLCQGDCVYTGWGREPINIGRLQRFATETATAQGQAAPVIAKKRVDIGTAKKKVACDRRRARLPRLRRDTSPSKGHEAVIFEKRAVLRRPQHDGHRAVQAPRRTMRSTRSSGSQQLGVDVQTGDRGRR